MRRFGVLLTAVALMAALGVGVLWVTQRSGSGARRGAGTPSHDLTAMLRSELLRRPFGAPAPTRVTGPVIFTLHGRGKSLTARPGPRAITGWSCPVASGSPCGARSRTDYLPLPLNGVRSVVRPPGTPGASLLRPSVLRRLFPTIHLSPVP